MELHNASQKTVINVTAKFGSYRITTSTICTYPYRLVTPIPAYTYQNNRNRTVQIGTDNAMLQIIHQSCLRQCHREANVVDVTHYEAPDRFSLMQHLSSIASEIPVILFHAQIASIIWSDVVMNLNLNKSHMQVCNITK
jgi:hypothetical protein